MFASFLSNNFSWPRRQAQKAQKMEPWELIWRKNEDEKFRDTVPIIWVLAAFGNFFPIALAEIKDLIGAVKQNYF